MTREEFADYILTGEQWTKATLAAVKMSQSGFIPECDVETFEREVTRPDGIVPVRKEAPIDYVGNCLRMWADMEAGIFSLGDIS